MIVDVGLLPRDPGWLLQQPEPVIVVGDIGGEEVANADLVVAGEDEARALQQRAETWPIASLTLVQLLRMTGLLPESSALDAESMAYGTLQQGREFTAWRSQHLASPRVAATANPPIALTRHGALLEATLDCADRHNALDVAMRDAWVEMLNLLAADDSIEKLEVRANGRCFSIGGDLDEFGSAPDPAIAHWVRSIHSPARLMARHAARISCHVHGACIGSGIELPAFACRLTGSANSHFQLPELQMGLIPGAGGTVSVTRRIGRWRTAWLVLSGRRINAKTALDWGLIDAIEEDR